MGGSCLSPIEHFSMLGLWLQMCVILVPSFWVDSEFKTHPSGNNQVFRCRWIAAWVVSPFLLYQESGREGAILRQSLHHPGRIPCTFDSLRGHPSAILSAGGPRKGGNNGWSLKHVLELVTRMIGWFPKIHPENKMLLLDHPNDFGN